LCQRQGKHTRRDESDESEVGERAETGKITSVKSITKGGWIVAYKAVLRTRTKKSKIQIDPDGRPTHVDQTFRRSIGGDLMREPVTTLRSGSVRPRGLRAAPTDGGRCYKASSI
jgi:hypothetical protein